SYVATREPIWTARGSSTRIVTRLISDNARLPAGSPPQKKGLRDASSSGSLTTPRDPEDVPHVAHTTFRPRRHHRRGPGHGDGVLRRARARGRGPHELVLRNVSFEVDDLQAAVDRAA